MWMDELRENGKAAWIERECAWMAQPEDIVTALAREGFEECKREVARSRRDRDPLGGVWQGLNRRTGSLASAVWVNRVNARRALMFLEIDGEPLMGGHDG